MLFCLSVALCFVSACVPATQPPQLAATPGAAVVVTGDWYDAGLFRARYPDGWRVITSPADAPPFVIFAAPDNCALIVLSVEPTDPPQPSAACEAADFETDAREIVQDRMTVYAVFSAPPDTDPAPFEQVIASLEPATP